MGILALPRRSRKGRVRVESSFRRLPARYPLSPVHLSRFPLVRRRECLVPTWRGWLAILLVIALAAFAGVRGLLPFLAVHDPAPGGVLIVEGWMPDYALAQVIEEFRREKYSALIASGTPLEKGAVLAEYQSYAELTAASLRKLGADPATVHAVPAAAVRQDRTYAAALAVKAWLRENGLPDARLNLVSLGAHSRRSRLLYEKAFGPGVRVGIIPLEDREFDPRQWWRSSAGFRMVTGEVIAYFYARFLFRPSA